jgi:hypothetical protein
MDCTDLLGRAAHGSLEALQGACGEQAFGPHLPVPVARSRTLQETLRILIGLDESGSIASSDPHRESHRATLLVCDWLARHSQNPGDEIGLVRFADGTDSISPVPAAEARARIDQALARQPGQLGGGTQLTPAVAEICRLLPLRRGQRRLALLVTDGQVGEPDEQLRALIGRLRAAADAVYLIALDHDGQWTAETHRRYRGLGLTDQITVGQLGSRDLAAAIATVLMRETGLATTTSRGRQGAGR